MAHIEKCGEEKKVSAFELGHSYCCVCVFFLFL